MVQCASTAFRCCFLRLAREQLAGEQFHTHFPQESEKENEKKVLLLLCTLKLSSEKTLITLFPFLLLSSDPLSLQTVCLIGAGILMSLSLSLLAYAAFADYTHALQEKKRRAQRSSSSNSEDSTHDPRALGGDSASTNGPYYQNVPISETPQDVSRGPGEYVEWDLGNLASAAFSSLSAYPAQPPPTHTHRQEYIEVPIRHPVSSPFNFQQPPGGLNDDRRYEV